MAEFGLPGLRGGSLVLMTKREWFISSLVFLALAGLPLGYISYSQEPERESDSRLGLLKPYAQKAIAEGKTSALVPAPTPLYGEPHDLREALAGSSLLLVRLIAHQSV